jgi:hypothetical protein
MEMATMEEMEEEMMAAAEMMAEMKEEMMAAAEMMAAKKNNKNTNFS